MRVSMHGRTLVEMAVVRICQLGELDDLASLIAELRGEASPEPANRASGGTDRQQPARTVPSWTPPAPQKKTLKRPPDPR